MKKRSGPLRYHPPCAKPEELSEGVCFNPRQLFQDWSLHNAICSHPKLTEPEKLLWLTISYQVRKDGFAFHSIKTLATIHGKYPRHMIRMLHRLEAVGLLGVKRVNGYTATYFLKYDPIFANCSLYQNVYPQKGDVSSMTGGGVSSMTGVPLSPMTPECNKGMYSGNDGFSAVEKANGLGVIEPPSVKTPVTPAKTKTPPNGYVTTYEKHPVRLFDRAKPFWYDLNPHQKANRIGQAMSILNHQRYYRAYLWNGKPELVNQAQYEIDEDDKKLAALGMWIDLDETLD